jgi:hypothetical protein
VWLLLQLCALTCQYGILLLLQVKLFL